MREDPISNQPIKGLQLMLKTIAYALDTIPVVNPDGIFDAATDKAVRAFQQEYGLPVTGVVDEDTFRRIVEVYALAQELMELAESPVIHFPAVLTIAPGQFHPHIYLAQGMFTAIHGEFPEFRTLELTGILDTNTEFNVRLLQQQAGLPVTGVIDKVTWNRLCLLYRILFDRSLLPSQG